MNSCEDKVCEAFLYDKQETILKMIGDDNYYMVDDIMIDLVECNYSQVLGISIISDIIEE